MYALILPKNDYMSNFPKYKLNSKKDILQMIKSMVHMSEKTSLKTYAEARSTIPVASSCLQHVCRQLAEELRNMFLCCSEDKFGDMYFFQSITTLWALSWVKSFLFLPKKGCTRAHPVSERNSC